MLLLTLIGLAIPFGNVIGLYFIRCSTLPELKFRKSLTIIETLITVISMAIPVGLLVAGMKDGADTTGIDGNSITKAIVWGLLNPIGIVATIIILWRRAK